MFKGTTVHDDRSAHPWNPGSPADKKGTVSVLMIFVDGVGIGGDDPELNPFGRARTTHLRAAFGRIDAPALRAGVLVVPTNATLSVGGLPQSATGQTTLLTGINAAQKVGRHVHGFCTREMAGNLDGASLFARVREGGGKTTFANAYTPEFFRGERRFLSVTTVAMKQAGLPFRDLENLARGEAVFHDITNHGLRKRGYDLPVVTPQEAGRRLARLALSHDFTLYEHFQTDQAGHDRNMDRGVELLERLDLLLGAVLEATEPDEMLVVVASDHGNLEDLSTRTHTKNPVPTMLWGTGREAVADGVQTLADIAPALLRHLRERGVINGTDHP